jgi:hypothetical protein
MGVNSQFVQARQKRGVVLRMPIEGVAQGQPSSNLACGLRIDSNSARAVPWSTPTTAKIAAQANPSPPNRLIFMMKVP